MNSSISYKLSINQQIKLGTTFPMTSPACFWQSVKYATIRFGFSFSEGQYTRGTLSLLLREQVFLHHLQYSGDFHWFLGVPFVYTYKLIKIFLFFNLQLDTL